MLVKHFTKHRLRETAQDTSATHLFPVDEPLEPGGRVRLGGGAVEDEAVPDPVVAQAPADHRASVKQL